MLSVAACGESATLPVEKGFGSNPTLPEPNPTWIPTVNIAPAKGWPSGGKPAAAPGLSVSAFATGLDHPRWLYVLPNGDVLVAETNAPPKPEDAKGIKGWIMKWLMKDAGAGVPSANRITLLRSNGKGVAETRSTFLEGLNSPFGMTLVGNELYVASSDGVVKFPYEDGDLRKTSPRMPKARSSMPRSVQTAMSRRTGSKPKQIAPTFSRSTCQPANSVFSRRVFAIRMVCPGSLKPMRCGLRSMNGMNWAVTWFPIT